MNSYHTCTANQAANNEPGRPQFHLHFRHHIIMGIPQSHRADCSLFVCPIRLFICIFIVFLLFGVNKQQITSKNRLTGPVAQPQDVLKTVKSGRNVRLRIAIECVFCTLKGNVGGVFISIPKALSPQVDKPLKPVRRQTYTVTFSAVKHRCPLTCTKFHCLVTEARVCQGWYLKLNHRIASRTPSPLQCQATAPF